MGAKQPRSLSRRWVNLVPRHLTGPDLWGIRLPENPLNLESRSLGCGIGGLVAGGACNALRANRIEPMKRLILGYLNGSRVPAGRVSLERQPHLERGLYAG